MENSIIVQCPCCGVGLEIINNGFLGSRAYPLPFNMNIIQSMPNAQSIQQCSIKDMYDYINSQTIMNLQSYLEENKNEVSNETNSTL